MLQEIRKNIRKILTPKPSSRKGQIGIVLVLMAAIGLILYAVSVNFGRVSQAKALTLRAANLTAAGMASFIASYGQKLFEEQLGGQQKVCGWSGFFMAFLKFIIIIIIIIISYFAGPQAGYAAWAMYAALALAAVASGASMVIQLTVVEPGITQAWNKMMSRMLTIEDQVIERGMQTALQNVVTDMVRVPDYRDLDQDGFFGGLTNDALAESAPDYVSRFSQYYTRRLQNMPAVNYQVIIDFQNRLREFVLPGTDNLAIYDPPQAPHVCFNYGSLPAECDPCCVPQWARDGEGVIIVQRDELGAEILDSYGNPIPARNRPLCCDDDEVDCSFPSGHPSTCASRSPYFDGIPGAPNDYGFIYDPFYQDSTNDFYSVLEKFGKDDEHRRFHVNYNNPNWHTMPQSDRQILRSVAATWPEAPLNTAGFFGIDSTGFYKIADGYPEDDEQKGIFPFFYKATEWGLELSSLTYGLNLGPEDDFQCHWCDPRRVAVGSCFDPPEIWWSDPQLALPLDPALTLYNGGWCVDRANVIGPGRMPLLADQVVGIDEIIAAPTDCASETGGWKKGADRFCDTVEPYSTYCERNLNRKEEFAGGDSDAQCSEADEDGNAVPRDCECGESTTNPAEFTEDPLDDFIYGSRDFLEWAMQTINMPPEQLYVNFIDWYEDGFTEWFSAPEAPSFAWTTGMLENWATEMQSFYDIVSTWLDRSYVASNCGVNATTGEGAWCVPDDGCPCVNEGETTGLGVEGVTECLDYNVNDVRTYSDPLVPQAAGNPQKFLRCYQACTDPATAALITPYEACHDLPRSLVPDFCRNHMPFLREEYAGQDADFQLIAACFAANPLPSPVIPPDIIENFTLPGPGLYPNNELGQVVQCRRECNATAMTYTQTVGGVTRTIPAWIAPTMTLTCVAGNDCDPTSAFMTQVSAAATLACTAFLHAPECETNKAALNNCLASAEDCAANPSGAGYAAMEALSCRPACSDLPQGFWHTWGYYDYGIPATFTDLGIESQITNLGSCGDAAYWTAVEAVLALGGAKCSSAAFLTDLAASRVEARNQRAKFRKRLEFLRHRLDQATEVRDAFDEMINYLSHFVEQPYAPEIQAIIDEYQNQVAAAAAGTTTSTRKLSSVVVYAWQDHWLDEPRIRCDSTGTCQPTQEGYWHMAKVEVRAPKRCNGACISDAWPSVKTYSKNWGTKRCYELTNRRGMVKVRIIRWDEDREPSRMRFPGGIPIWDIRFFHPKTGAPDILGNLAGTGGACASYVDPILADAPDTNFFWNNAFMINWPPAGGCDPTSPMGCPTDHDCWNTVHDFLRHGVSSVSCAMYDFVGEGTGFTVLFRPCDRDFLLGNN